MEPEVLSSLLCLCPREPAYWELWVCVGFFQSLPAIAGWQPTSHPPRVLRSVVFVVTHRSWLLRTESWGSAWRAHISLQGTMESPQ